MTNKPDIKYYYCCSCLNDEHPHESGTICNANNICPCTNYYNQYRVDLI